MVAGGWKGGEGGRRNCLGGMDFILFYYFFNFNFIYLFIYLVALGLHCYMRAFSSCIQRGLLFVVVHRLLIAVVSLVVELGL